MDELINDYIIVSFDGKVIGCEDKDTVYEYLKECMEDKIREYCESEGLDYNGLSRKKLRSLLYEENYLNDESKIYKTRKVINELKKSELDEEVKTELIELLTEYNAEFHTDEYDGFRELLNGIDDIDL
ncbi:MAG: hypothetical protein Q8930_07500 [Bacillota bacterium]|nr:hypothetical protein [Bacillota bacterium]